MHAPTPASCFGACSFSDAEIFDRDIARWDTAQVDTMHSMYVSRMLYLCIGCGPKTHTLSARACFSWQCLCSAADARFWSAWCRFSGALEFNQNIGEWDTARVASMDYMYAHRSLPPSLPFVCCHMLLCLCAPPSSRATPALAVHLHPAPPLPWRAAFFRRAPPRRVCCFGRVAPPPLSCATSALRVRGPCRARPFHHACAVAVRCGRPPSAHAHARATGGGAGFPRSASLTRISASGMCRGCATCTTCSTRPLPSTKASAAGAQATWATWPVSATQGQKTK